MILKGILVDMLSSNTKVPEMLKVFLSLYYYFFICHLFSIDLFRSLKTILLLYALISVSCIALKILLRYISLISFVVSRSLSGWRWWKNRQSESCRRHRARTHSQHMASAEVGRWLGQDTRWRKRSKCNYLWTVRLFFHIFPLVFPHLFVFSTLFDQSC